MINDGQKYRFVCGKFHFEHLQLKDLGVCSGISAASASSILVIYRGCSYRCLLASCTLIKYSPLRVLRPWDGWGGCLLTAYSIDIDLGTTSAGRGLVGELHSNALGYCVVMAMPPPLGEDSILRKVHMALMHSQGPLVACPTIRMEAAKICKGVLNIRGNIQRKNISYK